MARVARRPAFSVTGKTAEKLKTTSPATIGRHLKKGKEAFRLKEKSLAKPLLSLKSRIPVRAFCSREKRKTLGFRRIDAVRHCGQAMYGQYVRTLTAADVAS
ncbi:MAG: hypothetical protein LBH85_00965 [Treponema sp.]|jgi:hypothetical protein|nr:hypothetical protein [Treponema sp.]